MSGWVLVVDGIPYGFAVAGVSSVSSWPDGDPGVTILEGSLERPTGELFERIRPTEGGCDVSAMSFVLHDVPGSADYTVTDLCTRDLDSITKTYLTATATASATSLTVADGSIFGAFPNLDAWVNAECVRVTARAGNVLTVTRGRYGSRARAIIVSPDEGVLPEIFIKCPGITRRRCVLYRVRNGVASVRWIGHAEHAPRLNDDGTSWTISATHASTRELSSIMGTGIAGNAKTVGYDDYGAVIILERADASGVLGSSTRLSTRVQIHRDFAVLMTAVCDRATNALRAAGATNISVSYSVVGSDCTISVSAQSVPAFVLRVRIGDLEESSACVDTGSTKRAKVTLAGANRGGLVRFGWQPYTSSGATDSARLTVLAPSPLMPVGSADWMPDTTSYTGAVPVTATPVLVTDWDDDTQLVLDPRGQTQPQWTTNNTTDVDPAHSTFRAQAYLRSRDAASQAEPVIATAGSLTMRGVAILQREWLVESAHWLYAVRWLFTANAFGDESDSRSWDWSGIDAAAGPTGSGVAAAVNWRVGSDRKAGEFLLDECALRGAALSIRNGKLCVVAVRQPTASETVVATITDADLRGDSEDAPRAQLEQWEDGVVTAVQIASPLRDVTVIDQVARARYGDGITLQLRAEGLRNQRLAVEDPVQWAREIAQRPLRLWSQPTYLVRLPLTSAFVDRLKLGDIIEVSVSTLPSGSGTRGMVSRRVQVIGLSEDLDTGAVTVEALLFATAYGYAPCAKVESISGSTLTLATEYIESCSDYAGSSLASYSGTPNDGGASMFAVDDLVELVERDNAAPLAPQLFKVTSVNPATPSITLDASPSASWVSAAWVDVRTAPYASAANTQRDRWAYVCGSTAPQEIATGVRGRKWSA